MIELLQAFENLLVKSEDLEMPFVLWTLKYLRCNNLKILMHFLQSYVNIIDETQVCSSILGFRNVCTLCTCWTFNSKNNLETLSSFSRYFHCQDIKRGIAAHIEMGLTRLLWSMFHGLFFFMKWFINKFLHYVIDFFIIKIEDFVLSNFLP